MINVSEFTKRLMPDLPGCPEVLAQTTILDVISQFCARTWVVSRGMGMDIATADIDSEFLKMADIDIGDVVPKNWRPVGINGFTYNGVPYELRQVEIVTHVDTISSETRKKFYYFPDYQTISMYPFANSGTAYLEVAIAPLSTATQVDDKLYDYWLDPILAGAKARLFRMPNKPWTDLKTVVLLEREFKRGIVDGVRQLRKSGTSQTVAVQPRSDTTWL